MLRIEPWPSVVIVQLLLLLAPALPTFMVRVVLVVVVVMVVVVQVALVVARVLVGVVVEVVWRVRLEPAVKVRAGRFECRLARTPRPTWNGRWSRLVGPAARPLSACFRLPPAARHGPGRR